MHYELTEARILGAFPNHFAMLRPSLVEVTGQEGTISSE